MPQFAAFVTQMDDYGGPIGFLSVEAADAGAARLRVFEMAEAMETSPGRFQPIDSCCIVHFALPLEAAQQAVDALGNAVEIRSAEAVFTETLRKHHARYGRPVPMAA